MATIKRYRYIIDNDAINEINKIDDNYILKVYKGNSSNQAELIYDNYDNFEIEEVSTTIDFTKTTFTEAEVETAIRYNAVSNFKVGDILTINNKYCSQWVVIGKDHDGTTGTIDIMSTVLIWSGHYSHNGKYGTTSSYYAGYNAIIKSYYEFDNMIISSACKNINFKVASSLTDGTTKTARAKIISCVEMNFTTFDRDMPGYGSYKEGEPYTYFARDQHNNSVPQRWIRSGRGVSTSYYWTRSRCDDTYIWVISSTGYSDNKKYDTDCGIAPILRLGSMINE